MGKHFEVELGSTSAPPGYSFEEASFEAMNP